jgi:hypothetical protein
MENNASSGIRLFFIRDLIIVKITITFVMSVRLSMWNTSTPTRRIFMKFGIWVFFETLHEDRHTFLIIYKNETCMKKMLWENKDTHMCAF